MAGPNFRKGADAAQHASKGGAWARTEFFKLEDKGKVLVRFITDSEPDPKTGEGGWITVDQHQMVPTKPKPDGHDGNWPEKMGSVCRKDEAFDYGECYICDFLVDGKKIKSAAGRTWALACIREEVQENGQIVGYRDKTRTVTRKEGDKEVEVTEKAIVVVNMAWKNFFSTLKGFAEYYGTILDRDYLIIRSGSDQSTTYQIIPMDPIVVDDKGTRFDVRDPAVAERYHTDLDLGEAIADRASDDFYARFFDPRFTPSKDGDKVESTGQAPDTAKPTNEVDDEGKLAELANRVKGYGQAEGNGGGGEQQVPAAPAGAAKNLD